MDRIFLNYPDWQATADTLHLFLQMAGKVKIERSYREPEWGHVRMPLTVQGIGTGVIPGPDTNFEIYFNLREHHVDVQNTNYIRTRLELSDGLSVADFYGQLMGALEFIEAPTAINTEPQEFHDPVPFDVDTKHHSYDKQAVELFLDNLHFAQPMPPPTGSGPWICPESSTAASPRPIPAAAPLQPTASMNASASSASGPETRPSRSRRSM